LKEETYNYPIDVQRLLVISQQNILKAFGENYHLPEWTGSLQSPLLIKC